MAGALLNMVYAWAGAAVVVIGAFGTMWVTDPPRDTDTASGVTAIALAVFAVALVASLTL